MESRVILYIVLCCLFILEVKADDSNGYCTVKKLKRKTKLVWLYESHKDTTITCVGPNFLRIFCEEKTIYKSVPKKRRAYTSEYVIEPICCAGFTKNGSLCQIGCGPGSYGEQCKNSCNCNISNSDGYCNRTNGECICNRGWIGENCSQSCPDGYFGQKCESLCSCRNNASCNIIDGLCNCTVPGWTGDLCDQGCNEGYYGLNCSEVCTCNNNQTCDPSTGSCVCKAGRTGHNCTEVCRENTFGPDCNNICLCHPDGTIHCDPVNGTCECYPGKSGLYCQRSCRHGKYGEGCISNCTCSAENEYCKPDNGNCLSVCYCNREGTENCDDNFKNCTCSNRKLNETQCNHPNITYSHRFELTDEDVFDLCACRFDGDRLCFPTNNSCACKLGYKGRNCRNKRSSLSNSKGQSKDDEGDGKIQSVIIGVIVAAVVIFIGILIIVSLVCRSKRKKMKQSAKTRETETNHGNNINNENDTKQYSEVLKLENNKDGKFYDSVKDKEEETSFMNNTDGELYSKTNRDESNSVNAESQNLYSHTNMAKPEGVDIDDAYDIMEHNKQQGILDDTYDHMHGATIDSEYDTVNNKG